MPPCAKIAGALDTSGFGQRLKARSQHFRVDGPCKRFAAKDEVADNPGGFPPTRFQRGQDQLVEVGLGHGLGEHDVLPLQDRIEDGIFVWRRSQVWIAIVNGPQEFEMQSRNDFSKGAGERCPILLFKSQYDRACPVDGVRSIVQMLGNVSGLHPIHRLNPAISIYRNKLRTL
jgi:hypothetical protein